MRPAEFNDTRLTVVYDAMFGWSRDDDFFMSVVGEAPAARVLDLGCGTGRLALARAAAGHAVTGVDPARASLDAARAKPGAGQVTWIEGTSPVLPGASFDVAVMTSHVVQFFVTDQEWDAGFTIEQIYGGWNREPIGAPDGEFLVIARATA
jgi:2-polyprenyl-3-methyl-5-hydroxy-6-metoxy-1,4-benzoquinol methylase